MNRPTIEQIWLEVQRDWTSWYEKDIGDRLEKEWAVRNLFEWRRVLLGILTDRFGPPPALLVIFVEACEDLSLLRKMTRQAGTAASLDAFQL